jgi:hypothetical protein
VREEAKAHEVSISMVKAPLTEVDAGTDMTLRIRVSCSSGCDLGGMLVSIADDQGAEVEEAALAEFDGASNETDELVVKAPSRPGEYAWLAMFPGQENKGITHEEASASFSFIVKAHSTSIAVWDVPSPVAFHDDFKIKVGVKCSAGCSLAGHKIEIYNHEEEEVATGTLGDAPWSGTSGLYWAEPQLKAPGLEGYLEWTVRFPKPGLEVPHQEGAHSFGFATGRAPEHLVTVEAVERHSNEPVARVLVLLRPKSGYAYRGLTDESGSAQVRVPRGEYALLVSKGNQYTAFETAIEVSDDVTVKADLAPQYDVYG